VADGTLKAIGRAESAAGMKADLVSIQYLRAAAAVGVLIFHASQKAGLQFGMGAAGVDIFFVISGFIMWVVSTRRAYSPGEFLLRRAGRIAPLYWCVTLFVVAVDVLRPSVFPNMRLSAGHVIQSLLFVPHADPAGQVAPVIVPGWTLNYEVFFYLAFALTLLLPARRRAMVLSAGLVLLCLAGLAIPRGQPIVAAYTDPLVLEFVAGVWLAKAWQAGRLGSPARAWAAILAGGLILLAVGATGADASGWARLPYWGLPALLIVWGALSLERARRTRPIAALKLMGDASYSIYLAHGLALSVAFKVLEGRGLEPLVVLALAAPFAVLAGLFCHLALELPLLALFHDRRKRGPVRAPPPAWAFPRAKT
jgi:exopolysaccharide production protein ExoZ